MSQFIFYHPPKIDGREGEDHGTVSVTSLTLYIPLPETASIGME